MATKKQPSDKDFEGKSIRLIKDAKFRAKDNLGNSLYVQHSTGRWFYVKNEKIVKASKDERTIRTAFGSASLKDNIEAYPGYHIQP